MNGHDYRVRADWLGARQSVVYDVSLGPNRQADILSQAERAAAWVDWAIAEGELAAGDHLLVVGGGIAGCAAAMAARAVGVEVDLVDRRAEAHPLGPLPSARRKIHPTLYRWPDRDWREGSKTQISPPYSGKNALIADAVGKLRWSGGYGSEVFTSLVQLCQTELNGRWHQGDLHGPHQSTAAYLHLSAPDGPAAVVGVPTLVGRAYGRVLVCTGPGGERVYFPEPSEHRGYAFWDPRDPMIQVLSGDRDVKPNPLASGQGPIAIVGGGDGGRQDLVQALAGVQVVDLVESLDRYADGWFDDVTAEARAALAGIARADPARAEQALAPLAARHGADLLGRIRDHGGAPAERLARTTLHARGTAEATECFHLNRFLTLALHHAALPKHRLLHFREALVSLDGAPHAKDDDCWGEEHHATFEGPQGGSPHYLVIRLGLPAEPFWAAPEWRYRAEEAKRNLG